MTTAFTPERWAFEITHLLNAAFGAERFPIDIPMVAKEYTAQWFPEDPIISVRGDNLPNFDGALVVRRAIGMNMHIRAVKTRPAGQRNDIR
jgi:hypothetical protein